MKFQQHDFSKLQKLQSLKQQKTKRAEQVASSSGKKYVRYIVLTLLFVVAVYARYEKKQRLKEQFGLTSTKSAINTASTNSNSILQNLTSAPPAAVSELRPSMPRNPHPAGTELHSLHIAYWERENRIQSAMSQAEKSPPNRTLPQPTAENFYDASGLGRPIIHYEKLLITNLVTVPQISPDSINTGTYLSSICLPESGKRVTSLSQIGPCHRVLVKDGWQWRPAIVDHMKGAEVFVALTNYQRAYFICLFSARLNQLQLPHDNVEPIAPNYHPLFGPSYHQITAANRQPQVIDQQKQQNRGMTGEDIAKFHQQPAGSVQQHQSSNQPFFSPPAFQPPKPPAFQPPQITRPQFQPPRIPGFAPHMQPFYKKNEQPEI